MFDRRKEARRCHDSWGYNLRRGEGKKRKLKELKMKKKERAKREAGLQGCRMEGNLTGAVGIGSSFWLPGKAAGEHNRPW